MYFAKFHRMGTAAAVTTPGILVCSNSLRTKHCRGRLLSLWHCNLSMYVDSLPNATNDRLDGMLNISFAMLWQVSKHR